MNMPQPLDIQGFQSFMQQAVRLPEGFLKGGEVAMNQGMSSLQMTAQKLQQGFSQSLQALTAPLQNIPAQFAAPVGPVAKGGEIYGEARDTSKHKDVRTSIF